MGSRKATHSFRLVLARLLSGVSYNFAAVAYLLIVAVLVGVLLQYYAGTDGQTTPTQEIALLSYSARSSVAATTIGVVVAFFIGALSLLLLAWLPYKIAQIGSRMTQKLSAFIFDNPRSGFHMFVAKLLLYGPAIIVLIVLYILFASSLTFQLLTVGTTLIISAVIFAALRLIVAR